MMSRFSKARAGAIVAIVAAPFTASAQQRPALEEYVVDAGHSIIEFSIPFAFTRVKGRFTEWTGTILYDRTNPVNSSVTAVIDAKSIDTGWPHRDEHLRTSDFFDVERYPKIIFQSDRLRSTPTGWIADGRLTMHGVTKAVSLPIHVVSGAPQRSPESKNLLLDASSELRIARKDFAITGGSQYNSWFTAARAATMGDSVSVSIEIEGWLPDVASQRPAGVDANVSRVKTNGITAYVDRLRQARDSADRGRTIAGTLGPAWPVYFSGQDLTVRALAGDGRIADAVALAEAMTSLFGNWRSYLLLGYALVLSGKDREAGAAFTRAKALYKPPPPSTEKFKQVDEEWWQANQLVQGALESGQRKAPVQVARLLTELYPTWARAFVTLGQTLAAEGDVRGAGEAFATALKLDPDETRAIEWNRRLRTTRE
jgi:polyisoprenoid-binding protein YceI